MKKFISIILSVAVMSTAFTACGRQQSEEAEVTYTGITLSDDGILVGGEPASTNPLSAVYVSNDIVFYLEDQGSDYGEGKKSEEHSQSEADKHTVINITKPGNYMVSGDISYGQIAIDLGEDADENKDNVVNLTLNNANITCTVAPAIICYSAYECSSDEEEDATKDVNTEAAGFNINIADGSVNNINGSHVAKIYEPGTEDKLHKYDAAIESMVSFNINGTDGVLNLTSDNEGIETKLHMTINGGEININSCDDALNAGEDGVSVITINDGQIYANSNNGKEGDGIDSNGWVVINGGYVSAFGSSQSMDSGLDSDNGVYINGGTVYATGNMYDQISYDSTQATVVFSFDRQVHEEDYVAIRSSAGDAVAGFKSTADHTVMVYSSPLLTEDDYTLYKADGITGDSMNGIYANITEITGETQLAHSSMNTASGRGQRPQMSQGEMPEDMTPPEMPDGEMPQQPQDGGDMVPPQDMMSENSELEIPRGDIPARDENGRPHNFGGDGRFDFTAGQLNPVFTFTKGVNMFNAVQEYTTE